MLEVVRDDMHAGDPELIEQRRQEQLGVAVHRIAEASACPRGRSPATGAIAGPSSPARASRSRQSSAGPGLPCRKTTASAPSVAAPPSARGTGRPKRRYQGLKCSAQTGQHRCRRPRSGLCHRTSRAGHHGGAGPGVCAGGLRRPGRPPRPSEFAGRIRRAPASGPPRRARQPWRRQHLGGGRAVVEQVQERVQLAPARTNAARSPAAPEAPSARPAEVGGEPVVLAGVPRRAEQRAQLGECLVQRGPLPCRLRRGAPLCARNSIRRKASWMPWPGAGSLKWRG